MAYKKHERLAFRLSDILTRLNTGERLDVHELSEMYKVHLRTIQRDMNERFAMLSFVECGPRYYRIDKNKQGHLTQEEILRFARFASIQDLFPEVDRRFYQQQLSKSIMIKGFQYENIRAKQGEFDQITEAIAERHPISFDYNKVGSNEAKCYQLEPYHLINKNGIWYLVGLDNGKQKTFCFNGISNITVLAAIFNPNEQILDDIRQTDSIFHGNQINEIVVKISAKASGYFMRRKLLPNQELIRELEDGSLLLACRNVNPMEVIPIVQYWIPHAYIISPAELQRQMEDVLTDYLKN